MSSKVLRLLAVMDHTGLSRSTIYLKVSQGTFPKPVSLGARVIGWSENLITSWIESLAVKQ